MIRPGDRIAEISPLSGNAGLVETIREVQSQTCVVRKTDPAVTGPDGSREYTNTPSLVHAFGLWTTDDDIDAYIDRQETRGSG